MSVQLKAFLTTIAILGSSGALAALIVLVFAYSPFILVLVALGCILFYAIYNMVLGEYSDIR